MSNRKRRNRHHGPTMPPPLAAAVSAILSPPDGLGLDKLNAVIKGLRVGKTAGCIAEETGLPKSLIDGLEERYYASSEYADAFSSYSGRLTADDRRQRRYNMAQQVARGDRPSVVAARFRVTIPTVRKACHEFGVTWETPGGAGNPTADKTLEMIGRLAAGATAEEVAAEFGVSRGRASAVRARAVKAGIVKPGKKAKAE